MEFWTEVRRQVLVEGLSKRAACRQFGLSWHTLAKILTHEEPPGYRLKQPRAQPKIETFLPIIDQILIADRQAPRKQRHTAERIFIRLRDEHVDTAALVASRQQIASMAWRRKSIRNATESLRQRGHYVVHPKSRLQSEVDMRN